jgi:hypothetical protein
MMSSDVRTMAVGGRLSMVKVVVCTFGRRCELEVGAFWTSVASR